MITKRNVIELLVYIAISTFAAVYIIEQPKEEQPQQPAPYELRDLMIELIDANNEVANLYLELQHKIDTSKCPHLDYQIVIQ